MLYHDTQRTFVRLFVRELLLRDEGDDTRQHRPAWEIAAEQHPQLAMKNTTRPPLPPPKRQTRVDLAVSGST